jgi:hypothetical protein
MEDELAAWCGGMDILSQAHIDESGAPGHDYSPVARVQ